MLVHNLWKDRIIEAFHQFNLLGVAQAGVEHFCLYVRKFTCYLDKQSIDWNVFGDKDFTRLVVKVLWQ